MMPEIKFDCQVPLLPNVRPIIILSGSNYNMGIQYITQLKQIFGPCVPQLLVRKQYTKQEISIIKQFKQIINEYAPEMLEIFKGITDGAQACDIPLTYQGVIAIFAGAEEYFSTDSCGDNFPVEECSGFAAWFSATKDNKLICAGSKDHKPRPEVTIIAFPSEGGNSFIWTPSTIMGGNSIGGHPGMNNKGLAYVHHGASCWINRKPKKDWSYGVTMPIAVLHTLRFASNADQAKKMQLNYPDGCGYLGGFWVDTTGKAWIIESRTNPKAIRKPGDYDEDEFIYATNNGLCRKVEYCQDPPPEGNVYIPHGGWLGTGATISSVARNLQLWNMLHHYRGNIDLKFVKMMWRYSTTTPDHNSLEEADKMYYKNQGRNWVQTIGNLYNATVGILQPDDGDQGLYHASWGYPGRRAFPSAPGHHHYLENPTFSWYEIKLDNTPRKVVEAARSRAQYDLYYANKELRKLTYHDTAYAPLEKIFNKAAREWYKGDYYLEFPVCEKDLVNYLGKALRCFTKSQALARQVFNSLLPPACSAEELGL
jgi:hypothetical protein